MREENFLLSFESWPWAIKEINYDKLSLVCENEIRETEKICSLIEF